ncbi:MAG: hypothetical protein AAB036_03290 [Elusimicrobiota bacterium]
MTHAHYRFPGKPSNTLSSDQYGYQLNELIREILIPAAKAKPSKKAK